MKMRNEDVKKITEIKQYLLDPPVSFKLYDYALNYLEDAVTVLAGYADAKETIDYLQELSTSLKTNEATHPELRSSLKEAAVKISKLTRY